MSLLKIRTWVGLTIILGAVAGAAPLFAQTGGLSGTCKDEKGNLVVGYPILIEREEIKGTYKTKTNKKGEYIYIGLPIGNYKVTFQDPSGRALFFQSKHVGMGDPTVLDFNLAKERATQMATPEAQKKIEEQGKEQKQLGSLKGIFDQGQALYNEKKYTEAAAVFEQALPLAKEKNVPIVLGRLADSYHKARQLDKAVQTYQMSIVAKPDDATVHNNLGSVYADMGKIPEAQQEFKKAAELDPSGASRYYFNLGAIMYNQGKMDEAIDAFKKSTDLDSRFADAFFMQGRALMGKMSMDDKGNVVAAPGTAEALQNYLKLEPSGKYASEAQAMLQTIQGKVQTEFKKEKKKKG